MKIAIVSHYSPCKSGYATYTRDLVNSILRVSSHHSVVVIGCADELNSVLNNRENLSVKRVWKTNHFGAPLIIFYSLLKHKVDKVYFYYPLKIFTVNFLNALFDRIVLPCLMFLLKIVKIPVIVDIDDVVPFSYETSHFSIKHVFNKVLSLLSYKLLSYSVETFCFRNKNMERVLVSDYRLKRGNLRFIPHGVQINVDNSISEKEAKHLLGVSGRFVLLYFGYLSRYKGVDQLIKALPIVVKKYPEVCLLIVGDYFNPSHKHMPKKHRFLPYLRDLVNLLGLSNNVKIESRFIPDFQVPIYFHAADIVCFPYITSNISASGILTKAMAYGKPVISSDSLWFTDVIINEITGLVVPMSNHVLLGEAINHMLGNQVLRVSMGKNLKNFAQTYSWSNVGLKILDIIEKIKQ